MEAACQLTTLKILLPACGEKVPEGRMRGTSSADRSRRSGTIDQMKGEREKIVGKIQERYGIAKAEAEKQADAWSHALKETQPESTAASRL